MNGDQIFKKLGYKKEEELDTSIIYLNDKDDIIGFDLIDKVCYKNNWMNPVDITIDELKAIMIKWDELGMLENE